MSEPENTPPSLPPPSTPKTAAVPLKKETVRITLRPRPGAGAPTASGLPSPDIAPKRATAPIQLPSAPLPPPAPKSGTNPVKLPPAPVAVALSSKTTSSVPVMVAASAATSAVPPKSLPTPMAPPVRPLGAPPAATIPMSAPRPPGAPGVPPAVGARPPGAPGVPVAPRPPGAPVAPGAPRPPGVPGAPPMAGAPRPPGVPGAPQVPGAPRVETGATTAPLKPAAPGAPGAAPRPPISAPRAPGAAGAAPLAPAASGGAALPKATVKLQQTQPMSRPSISAPPSAPVKRTAPAADSQQFYEEKDPDEGLMPLSVVCLLFSVILLFVQMFATDRVASSAGSPIMVPPSQAVKWHVLKADGSLSNDFMKILPQLPTVQ